MGIYALRTGRLEADIVRLNDEMFRLESVRRLVEMKVCEEKASLEDDAPFRREICRTRSGSVGEPDP